MNKLIVSLGLGLWISVMASIALAAPKAAPKGPVGPVLTDVAVCNDGKTYGNATGSHSGACSGHKGVASWLDGSPVKAPKVSHYR